MGIDAVALLRISGLGAPRTRLGTEHYVEHRGDATLLHTMNRYEGAAPDEHALALRQLLGAALDAHDDPRGILFFPDVLEPKGADYDAIASAVGRAGVWAPRVGADHVPLRYTAARAGTHEALVAAMIAKLGRDEALSLDELVQVFALVREAAGAGPDAADGYAEQLDGLRTKMGEAFVQKYEPSVRHQVARTRARQEAQQRLVEAWLGGRDP
jgi:hypothetical protein